MKARLTRYRPTEYDAVPSGTIDVVERNLFILCRDVLEHFQ